MPAEHKLSVRDGDRVREVLLIGTVTVGRAPTCEISSSDPRLSRTHAAFDVVGGDVVVRDLGSSNGTMVNGTLITEHRLGPDDRVEVGPFVMQLIKPSAAVVERRPHINTDNEATVMRPMRVAAAPPPEVAARAPVAPPAPPRIEPPPPVRPATRAEPRVQAAAPVAPVAPAPVPIAPAAAAPTEARNTAKELSFANATLLWIVPVVLISFLAGALPDLMQPDERTPLLRAHYRALANSAVDLVKTSREPAMPIDNVSSALRRQAGVTAALVVGADGRVLAPLDQAGTTVPPPQAMTEGAPSIVETADDAVDVRVSSRTADGRAVQVLMTVNPERIHPAPPGSPAGTVLLILSLGAAWLVARQLTKITDSRLSRLGEEVELMATRQISTGRDPFTLGGGQRILDAVMFALSSVGRIASDAPAGVQYAAAGAGAAASAAIDADAAFRIISFDKGCESLLGIDPRTAAGAHLIDALPDQAIADEVMRLLTMAAPGVVSGEASGDRGRLGIEVTRGGGTAPLAIRFKRL